VKSEERKMLGKHIIEKKILVSLFYLYLLKDCYPKKTSLFCTKERDGVIRDNEVIFGAFLYVFAGQ
jgi:hypothetical protein